MKPDYNPAARMDTWDRHELLAAARTAKLLWPDVLGELVANTLQDVAEFGYRLGGDSTARRLIARITDEQRRRNRDAA